MLFLVSEEADMQPAVVIKHIKGEVQGAMGNP